MIWLDSITDSVVMNLSKLWEIEEDRGAWRATVHEVTKSWTQLSDWTATNNIVTTEKFGKTEATFWKDVDRVIKVMEI